MTAVLLRSKTLTRRFAKRNTLVSSCGMDAVSTESMLIQWGNWQRSANLSQRTITERASVIRHLLRLAQCGPTEIQPENIIEFTTRPGVSTASRATYHASIRAYHDWLVRTGQRPDNPTLKTPRPKRPKGLPRPVPDAKLANLLAGVNRRRTRMMIMLAAFCGLRVHEIAKIRGEDVDLAAQVLFVNGKGGKVAAIPLHQEVADLAEEFPREGWWFPSYVLDGPVRPGSVSKAIHKTMVRNGVAGKPHQLRHWYGTTLVRNGVDLRTVQELMRHESLATTQIYTQVSDLQRRNAISALSLTR
jgi:integrase/recombinase XerD